MQLWQSTSPEEPLHVFTHSDVLQVPRQTQSWSACAMLSELGHSGSVVVVVMYSEHVAHEPLPPVPVPPAPVPPLQSEVSVPSAQ